MKTNSKAFLGIDVEQEKGGRPDINGDEQSFQVFSKEITEKHKKTISEEEIQKLVFKAKSGCEESRNRVFEANIKFIYQCAKRFTRFTMFKDSLLGFMDLISIGFDGITKAIDRYEKRTYINKKGEEEYVKFLSFAVYQVTSKMIQECQKNQRVLNFPGTKKQKKNRMQRKEYIQDVVILRNAADEITLHKKIPREYSVAKGADDLIIHEDFYVELDRSLSTLTNEREGEIVKLFFGIGFRNHSLEEIGEIFDVTGTRVGQIKEKAIRRLRHTYRNEMLRPFLNYDFSEETSLRLTQERKEKLKNQKQKEIQQKLKKEVL